MSFQFDHWEIDDNNYPVIFSHRRRSLTKTPPLLERQLSLEKKKRVQFAEKCSVVLIPCRREYMEAGIGLWNHPDDQEDAKAETMEEIRCLIDYNPMLTTSMALKYLYQPKYECSYAYHQEDSSYFYDAKERCNILLIDSNPDTARMTSMSFKQVLQPLNQFVLSIVHEETSEDAIACITNTCTAVSTIDVIVIHENIFVDTDNVEEDEDALLNLLLSIHTIYQEKNKSILIGMMISDNKCSNRLKELGKRGSIDFVWKIPILTHIPMLPLILNERRSCTHSLPVFTSYLQHHMSSPCSSSGSSSLTSSSLSLLGKKKFINTNHSISESSSSDGGVGVVTSGGII